MDSELKSAKSSYRTAKEEGNHREEARWANVIGDILKNRGEYVQALKWIRLDYEISRKYLPDNQLLTTCQSLGEIYLRLERFNEALTYQVSTLFFTLNQNPNQCIFWKFICKTLINAFLDCRENI